jgi:hypothetical protein
MTRPLEHLTTRQLLASYIAALSELKERGVTRSTNNPAADYAELLFTSALGLTLTAKSTKGHDATDTAGLKYEIKGRRITAHNGSCQLGALRGLDASPFDFLCGVLFNEDFSVMRACVIPHHVVVEQAKYLSHTNSWRFILRPSVWSHAEVVDVTSKLQLAEISHV